MPIQPTLNSSSDSVALNSSPTRLWKGSSRACTRARFTDLVWNLQSTVCTTRVSPRAPRLKLYARTDKMFVKRYEEETNLRCQLVLDASRSMAYPDGVTLDDDRMSKLKFAVLASAALIELFRRQRDAVGLSLFSESLDLQTPARSSRAHHRMLFDKLEGLLTEPGEARPTSAIDALHQIAEATPRRSLVIVFSDMLDKTEDPEALVSALQHLRHNKHEVVVFHLLDAGTEVDFDFADRPTRFVDLETGRSSSCIRRKCVKYVSRMAKLTKTLRDRCGAHGIDWVDVDGLKEFCRC